MDRRRPRVSEEWLGLLVRPSTISLTILSSCNAGDGFHCFASDASFAAANRCNLKFNFCIRQFLIFLLWQFFT
jgi:hypothetical protein